MKHAFYSFFSLLAIAGAMMFFVSCDSDDADRLPEVVCPPDLSFVMDAQGVPGIAGMIPYSRADFERDIVGHAWCCESTYEISEQGTVSNVNLWNDMIGKGPVHRFFDKDSVTLYTYNDAYGYLNGGLGYSRLAYTYDERDNGVYVSGRRSLQLYAANVPNPRRFMAVEHIAYRSDGSPVYGYSIFRRLDDKEYNRMKEQYRHRWRQTG